MRAFTRVAAAMFLMAGAAGCKFPYPADVLEEDAATPPGHAVGGTVTGLWTGAGVTLHLAAEGVDEDLAIRAGEPFAFAHRLEDGATYTVTIANDGDDHDCQLGNGSGRIDGADVDDLAVTCTNLVPHGITISTPVTFTFDPRTTRYPLDVSILQQEVSVTVTGTTLTSVKVSDTPVPLGQPSAPVPLGQGSTSVFIDVAKGPISQRYELAFNRGAAPIVEVQHLRAGNIGANDFFGISVAASGEYVAIGAKWEDSSTEVGADNAVTDTGAVYIFRRSGNSWIQRQILKGSAVTQYREFGTAAAMDDDLLVVGAHRDDERGTDAGAVHVFRLDRQSGMWAEEQRITLPSGRGGDFFGYRVAVAGGLIVVSCPLCEVGAVTNAGAVHVYQRAGGTWQSTGTLTTATPSAQEQIGLSGLAFDGDTLAVPGGDVNGSRMHVWRRSDGQWLREVFPLTHGVTSLAIERGALAAGDQGDRSGTGQPGDTSSPNSGAIHVYERTNGAWSRAAFLKAATPTAGAGLGAGVAICPDLVLSTEIRLARLQPFLLVGGTWVPQPQLTPGEAQDTGEFGLTVDATPQFLFVAQERGTGPQGQLIAGGVFVFK